MLNALFDVAPISLMMIIFYILIYYVFIPINAKKSLQGSQILAQHYMCEWASDGLTISTARGSTRYFWTDFLKMQDSANAFLLYYSKGCALILPKRAFATEADQSAFERLIKASVKG
jgi:hypothetical protein